MDTDFAVITAATHLQSRIEKEQSILPANGHASTTAAAQFPLNSNHEVDCILSSSGGSGWATKENARPTIAGR